MLLLDGEHLEGAMQNRVLNVSVLAAARHDTVIPVSCVERGRWGYGSVGRPVRARVRTSRTRSSAR